MCVVDDRDRDASTSVSVDGCFCCCICGHWFNLVPTELSCCLSCVQVLHNIALEIRSISLCITGDRCKDFLHAITCCTVHYVPTQVKNKSMDSFFLCCVFPGRLRLLRLHQDFAVPHSPPPHTTPRGRDHGRFCLTWRSTTALVCHPSSGRRHSWPPELHTAPSQAMVDLTSCPSELGAASTWCGIVPNRRRSVDRERRSPCQYGALFTV